MSARLHVNLTVSLRSRSRSRTPPQRARVHHPRTPPKEGPKEAEMREELDKQAREGRSLKMTHTNTKCIQHMCRMLVPSEYFENKFYQIKFRENKFRDIQFSNCSIGQQGARLVAELIGQNNPHLQRLDLSYNSLGGGLDHFKNALQKNDSLRVLSLRSNNVTCKGVGLICEGLAHGRNQSLRILDLSVNPKIGDTGAQILKENLLWPQRDRIYLRELKLAQCNIGDEGAESLAALFGGTPRTRLDRLDLSGNHITNDGAYFFRRYLGDQHNSLNVLNLRENQISRNRAHDLRAAAGHAKTVLI